MPRGAVRRGQISSTLLLSRVLLHALPHLQARKVPPSVRLLLLSRVLQNGSRSSTFLLPPCWGLTVTLRVYCVTHPGPSELRGPCQWQCAIGSGHARAGLTGQAGLIFNVIYNSRHYHRSIAHLYLPCNLCTLYVRSEKTHPVLWTWDFKHSLSKALELAAPNMPPVAPCLA